MSYEKEFVLDEDKEDLVYLESQSKSDGQTFGVVIRTEDQNSIMTERDKIVSQKKLISNKEEGNHKDEDEATMSQMEEEIVLGLRRTELTDRNNQRIEEQLLKSVKTEVEKSFADTEMQHTDEILEGNQVENKCLEYWL